MKIYRAVLEDSDGVLDATVNVDGGCLWVSTAWGAGVLTMSDIEPAQVKAGTFEIPAECFKSHDGVVGQKGHGRSQPFPSLPRHGLGH